MNEVAECAQCRGRFDARSGEDFCSPKCEQRFRELEIIVQARSVVSELPSHDGNARRRARILALLDSLYEDDDDAAFLPEDKRAANDDELGWIGDYAARAHAMFIVSRELRRVTTELDPRVYDALKELKQALSPKGNGWKPPPASERQKGLEALAGVQSTDGTDYLWAHVQWDGEIWRLVYNTALELVEHEEVTWFPAPPRKVG